MRLDGAVAIVTGGAQGIGRSLAEGLAAEGARLVIADLRGAEDAAAALAAGGPEAIGVTVDVSREEDVARMAAAALERFGRIDALVNNAGIYTSLVPTPFEEIDPQEWKQVFDVNVLGMFLCCRAVLPAMRAAGGGRIVNIASGTPFKGVPYLLHYVTSKGAVVALTRALAREVGGDGVLVNTVAPGFTMSDGVKANPVQIEKLQEISAAARVIRRDQYPEDIVGAVVFFCSPESAFVTGQALVVDGGAFFPLILQLIDRTLEPGEVLARDESCPRALYVVDGEVRLDGTSLHEGQAAHHAGALACQAPEGAELLVWELCREADPSSVLAEEVVVSGQRLLRCDRVDFPPGGVAYLHTHQGPGIRRLVLGAFRVETAGVLHDIPLGGAWFEAGPDPVYAEVVGDSPAAFVRVMVLPRELLGKPSIRYVRDEDREKPKSQRYSVFVDEPIDT